jgi:oxygen-dependent protoporphyrinogen oxidase
MQADVIVVGAGISGLATAWNLQRRGLQVVVLEAGTRAGGTIGSLREADCLIETGPNSTLETTPLIAALLDDIGIAGERIDARPAAKNRFVLRQGRLIALPLTPLAFAATRLFSWRAKLALLREPFVAASAPDADETLGQFVRRRLGREFLDYAINPFVAGVYAGDPDKLSLRAAFPRLFELEQTYGSLIRGQILGARQRRQNREKSKQNAPMLSFRGGMQTLTDGIAQRLQRFIPATRADRLVRDIQGEWEVAAQASQDGMRLRAPCVILATPADAAARLVQPHAAPAAAALNEILYPPVASVASRYDRSDVAHPLDGFGFLVPAVERRQILGTLFSSSLFDHRAPAGSVLLTSFVGGLRQPNIALQDEGVIAATVHAELSALLGTHAPPRHTRVTRWPRAIPQYAPGHDRRMARLADCESALPGLFFCANYRGGIAVGDCIKSAHAVAERAATYLATRARHGP